MLDVFLFLFQCQSDHNLFGLQCLQGVCALTMFRILINEIPLFVQVKALNDSVVMNKLQHQMCKQSTYY